MLNHIPLNQISITDSFFAPRMRLSERVAIPYMWAALHDQIHEVAPSGCIANFEIAAGIRQGDFSGWWFQDSDLWKWIEGAAYSLHHTPDPTLEQKIDEAVDLASKAQMADGYLDTYYIIRNPEKRFTNLRDHHELYVAGHMFEAAVAYYEATGKVNLLNVACKMADCLDRNFGPEPEKLKGYPGHEEVELGLARLFRVTHEERYLKLALFFLDMRGKSPCYFDEEARARGEEPWPAHAGNQWKQRMYHQALVPVREQTQPVGHAVRQGYLLSGMAETGGLLNDTDLVQAADRVFRRIISRQMYITGGVGSCHEGESFTLDYDLPPERCYAETCASIALIMTAIRLHRIHPHAMYGDIIEKALYNGILSGISLDGTRYFYMNPLEVWPERCEQRYDLHIDDERQGWFGCACCPPNLLRTLTGLGQYLYTLGPKELFVDQYVSSSINCSDFDICIESGMPWRGDVKLTIQKASIEPFTIALRIPSWAASSIFTLNGKTVQPDIRNGYAEFHGTFHEGSIITAEYEMVPKFIHANSHVPNYAGKVALQYGPMIYCMEEVDNGSHVWNLLAKEESVSVRFEKDLLGGINVVRIPGFLEQGQEEGLYTDTPLCYHETVLTFIPYYAWGNRGKGEMTVWFRSLLRESLPRNS